MLNKHLRIESIEEQSKWWDTIRDIGNKFPKSNIVIAGSSVDDSFSNLIARMIKTFEVNIVPMKTNFGGSLGRELLGDIGAVLNSSVYNDIVEVDPEKLQQCTETVVVTMSRSIITELSHEAEQRAQERYLS